MMNKKTIKQGITKSYKYLLKLSTLPQIQFIILGIFVMMIGRNVFNSNNPTGLNFLAEILVFTVAALGLNILLGFSGLVSLATAAFIGVTTNGMHILINTYEMNFILAAIVMLVISGILGMFIGFLSLQMEGIYLAIATLFVGYIITQIFTAAAIFNNGDSKRIGAINFFGDKTLNIILPADRLPLFNILVICTVIAFFITYHIVKSPTGRALMATSRSQHAAEAMGIVIKKYRLYAFVIATMFSSFAGIMHVMYAQTTGTADKWGLATSLIILAVVVIGGMKSIMGMLLGAFIIWGIPAFYLREISWLAGLDDILTGLLLVLVVIFYPYGAAQIYYDLKKLYYKLKTKIKQRMAKKNE